MMEEGGFLHNYYDWAAFEHFVKELYAAEGDVVVEHNVTEVDRYGAKRQIDVKITRRTRFHTYVTLIECKRWKEPVSRDRVDVLASSIEALGAQKGAIFTTTGYETSAVEYARGRQIDIFVVRDLTPVEWGLPGRHVNLKLQVWAGEFREIVPIKAQAMLLTEPPVEGVKLEIWLDKDKARDPDLDLRSVQTGARGPNLINVLSEAHGLILKAFSKGMGLLHGGKDGERLEIVAATEFVFHNSDYRQLRIPTAVLKLNSLSCKFVAIVSQSDIHIDRGNYYDFALVIENYMSEQRQVAHKLKGSKELKFTVMNPSANTVTGAVENGTLLSVFTSAWVSIGKSKPTMKAVAGNLIRVHVDVDREGNFQLELESAALDLPKGAKNRA